MAQLAGPVEDLSDAIGRLASDTTELGIVVGDMFRYAAFTCLFGQQSDVATFIAESHAWATESGQALLRRVRHILDTYRPTGGDLRRVGELQQAVNEYSRIAERSRHIAEQAFSLGVACESLLQGVDATAPELLDGLFSQVYEQMRGVFLVTAARDVACARMLSESDAEVEAYYHAIEVRLKRIIKSEPLAAIAWQRVLIVAKEAREIGSSVVNICQSAMFTTRITQ